MTPTEHECELGERAGATLGLSAQSGAWRGRLVHRPAVINSASVRAGGARGCSKCALQPWGRVGHQPHVRPCATLVV